MFIDPLHKAQYMTGIASYIYKTGRQYVRQNQLGQPYKLVYQFIDYQSAYWHCFMSRIAVMDAHSHTIFSLALRHHEAGPTIPGELLI